MNITSLLITLAGIIIIIALYLMSRVAQSKLPQKKSATIPNIKDNKGQKFTSVLDDIPARDGSTPQPKAPAPVATAPTSKPAPKASSTSVNTPKPEKLADTKPSQIILFISAQGDNSLDGNTVQTTLRGNGLVFGDMDIYHYMVKLESGSGMASLFRVANGMAPWTLTDEDLVDKNLAGLSIVMNTPCEIDDDKAIKTFLNIAEKIASATNGLLKNQQQQILSPIDKENIISSIKK